VTGASFACAVGSGKQGLVGWFDHHLEIGIGGPGLIEGERIDGALVGDQVKAGVDACLRRMNEAVVSDRIDNPEVLVAGRCIENLLCRRKLNERGIAHLAANVHDVVGVVFDDAGGGLLGVGSEAE
jgi:hypothetical protein